MELVDSNFGATQGSCQEAFMLMEYCTGWLEECRNSFSSSL